MSNKITKRLSGGGNSPDEEDGAENGENNNVENSENETPNVENENNNEVNNETTISVHESIKGNDEAVSTNQNEIERSPSLELITTGDKNVDELIEYIHTNLREACETLSCLGDNIEQEIKSMFEDAFGKMRKWVNDTETKVCNTKSDIENLQKELKTKIETMINNENEIKTLKDNLATTESANVTLKESLSHTQSTTKDVEKEAEKNDTIIANEETVENTESTPVIVHKLSTVDEAKDSTSSEVILNSTKTNNKVSHELGKKISSREAELEREIFCLKKENERLIKERTEYENAIQRALLKGVSSLNAEALKVLRNPPGCYNPCGPSPSSIDSFVPCPQKTRDMCNGLNTPNHCDWQPTKKNHSKKTCTSANCPSAKHCKKSPNLLLLNERDTRH